MTVSYLIVFLYSLRAKFNLVQTAGVWSFYITLKPHDEAGGGRAAVGRATVQESLWTLYIRGSFKGASEYTSSDRLLGKSRMQPKIHQYLYFGA